MNLSFDLEDIVRHGVSELIDIERIQDRIMSGPPLRVKLGIDPTSPLVHVGRSMTLWRLRAFQELGHEIHFIIGDYTGQIGDTSDKESERPMLTEETVREHVKRYEEQIWMILNPDKRDHVHIHYNSEWLSKLGLGTIGNLADAFSVNSFIKRELIAKRLETGSRVSLREMLYPLMQGYDSVVIGAEIEIGGNDQRFNILAGRTLQEQAGQLPQGIILNQLIPGTDGRKMSSSWGNVIALLDTPQDKFGKAMTVKDDVLDQFVLILPRSMSPYTPSEINARMAAGENPRDLKENIAWALVALYHGEEEADRQREAFSRQFTQHQLPEDMPVISLSTLPSKEYPLVSLLCELGMAPSRSEARRLIQQGGVRIGNEQQADEHVLIKLEPNMVIQVGKRNFRKISD